MADTSSHLLLFSFLLLSPTAFATGVLYKGRNITDGETLVSAKGTFTLGFLSPGASNKRYLGIWFSVSSDAVCWVANRVRPLNDTSGVLVVGHTGSLLLLDGFGQVVWSSNSPNSSSVETQLGDNGNLVVLDRSSNTTLWQSFDHPSDTLLPDMKLGKNLWTGGEWFLTSWRSADDPSPGDYRRTLDTSGLPEVVLWQGNVKTYRTGPWNGLFFNGVPEASSYANNFPLQVTISPGEKTYMYTAKAGAPLTRVVVNYTGVVERLVWVASSRSWETFFRGPRDICDAYAKCGAFGLCDADAVAAAFCSCLKGFSPASPSAWSVRETSGGCRRNVALDCGNGTATTDGFVVVPGVKLPDTHNASVDTSITLEECKARCLVNCSCLAYAAADIRGGGGGGGSGCIIWTDGVVDLRYVDKGQDLYLRLAKSELAKRRTRKVATVPVIGVPSSVFLLVVLSAATVICWRRRRIQDVIPENINVPSYELHTVMVATGNFSEMNIIGDGGFGIVYEGQLPDGRKIAAKRLKQSALTSKGKKDFIRELQVVSNLRHDNIVELLAYCSEGNERILIYKFMRNGSLDGYIFGEPIRREMLNWRQRLDIINGIAEGVAYLHKGSGKKVVHRDIKPCNILLDDDWKPKIADFGTARQYEADLTGPVTLIGSKGYAAPEYVLQGNLTLKCDVYSFGVVLLEIVSGQGNGAMHTLVSRAWDLWDAHRTMDLLDSAVALPPSEPELLTELKRCIQIGLLCVQQSTGDRPTMSAVVVMLNSKSSEIDTPKKPVVDSRTREKTSFWRSRFANVGSVQHPRSHVTEPGRARPDHLSFTARPGLAV